jgi:L-alanine-DL-glutamate epimerase-like enolase superfamily enzyme
MKLLFHPFDLEMKHTFTISHGSHDIQKILIVELNDGLHQGFGEATENPYYGVTVEKMMNDLEQIRDLIEENEAMNPEEFWQLTHTNLSHNPFAQCALDMAKHDLYGKKKGFPLYKLWGYNIDTVPLTNYTIGIDSIEKMVEKMKEFPWPLYKIKLGTKEDVKIIRELRKHTAATFRIDANCAWSAEETIGNSHAFKELNVEFIEQPLPANDFEGMKVVYERSALPVIADESCMVESDVKKCHHFFHGVNIKLTKCGGLTPGRRMIEEAKSLGMKVMVGCMTESSVGISAIAQLLPLLDYVDMDGAMLIKADVADGVKIEHEKIIFPDRNGTGASLKKYQ